MKYRNYFRQTIIIFGFSLTLIELVLSFFHNAICESQGCAVVNNFAIYGEKLILVLGVLFFFGLIIVENVNIRNTLLTLGLTVEGYLFGVQVFIIHQLCYFCLGVFFLILILILIDFFDKTLPVYNVSYFFAVLLMVFLIRLPYLNLNKNTDYLFYLSNCEHCEATISYLEDHKIAFVLKNASQYKSFLEMFGINKVPCLIVKKKNHVTIVVGENAIKRYYSTKSRNNPFLNNSDFRFDSTCVIGKKCN